MSRITEIEILVLPPNSTGINLHILKLYKRRTEIYGGITEMQ